MSTTNFTETLQLPQCIATDKVNWLEDFNDLGAKVDAFAKETKTQLTNLESTDDTTANALESMQATLEEQSSLNQKNATDIAGLKESVDLQTTHNNEQDEEIRLLQAQDSALETAILTKANKADVDSLNASVTLLNQKTTALENITGSTSINAPTQIAHTGDLNTIINTGFYYSPGNNQISNMPVVTTPTTSFTLNVYRAATGGIIQHFICGSQKSGTQYIRYVNTGGESPIFGEWKEVVSRDVLEEEFTNTFYVENSVQGYGTLITKGVLVNDMLILHCNFKDVKSDVGQATINYTLPFTSVVPSSISNRFNMVPDSYGNFVCNDSDYTNGFIVVNNSANFKINYTIDSINSSTPRDLSTSLIVRLNPLTRTLDEISDLL